MNRWPECTRGHGNGPDGGFATRLTGRISAGRLSGGSGTAFLSARPRRYFEADQASNGEPVTRGIAVGAVDGDGPYGFVIANQLG